jgi:hypothetical protein
MRRVNLQGLSYVGADIVRELIVQNQHDARKGITFRPALNRSSRDQEGLFG